MSEIPQEWVEKAAVNACRITDRYIDSTGVPCAACTSRARAVLAAVLPALTAERDTLVASVERVRALHSPDPRSPDLCAGCRIEGIGGRYLTDCPTRTALDSGVLRGRG